MGSGATRTFVVEHYWPDVTADAFRASTEQVRAAAGELAGVRLLHATLVPQDESAFCVFAAVSEQDVQAAYARAGVRFERIVEALDDGEER